MTTNYKPIGPYILLNGKYAGKALEQLMFLDYGYIIWKYKFLKYRILRAEELHEYKHLRWLIIQGQSRQSQEICPYCMENLVSCFFVISGSYGKLKVSSNYTVCADEICHEKCIQKIQHQNERLFDFVKLPFRFSSLRSNTFGIRNFKEHQRMITKLFQIAFRIPVLRKDKLFQFFSENYDEIGKQIYLFPRV